MIIKIDDKWSIDVDTHSNYQPLEFKKGTGEVVTVAGNDWISEDKHIRHPAYLPDLGSALDYIVEHEAIRGDDCDIKYFLKRYSSLQAYFKSFLNDDQIKVKEGDK